MFSHRSGPQRTPLGRRLFGTSGLPLWIFGPLALGAFVLLAAQETRKAIADRFAGGRWNPTGRPAGGP